MKIIVGLGNPGREYENTKHNVGFIAIDKLGEKHQIKVKTLKHKALIGEGFISGEKVILVKPQTYMNLSGESVERILSYYKLDPTELIVVYDDIDVKIGHVRIRKKGSAGTHNGMKSIIYMLDSDDFPRIRIGIGGNQRGTLANYVLNGFEKKEVELVEKAITNAVDSIESILAEGMDIAMGKYNTKPEKAKDKDE